MRERLLIVEDEDTLCESLRRVFMREGYVVDIAGSAEAALLMLQKAPYDLIITDIMLPGMNGIELLKICRSRNQGQAVIIMTAYDNLWTSEEAMDAGAYGYITKPLSHEDIKKIVRNALDERQQE